MDQDLVMLLGTASAVSYGTTHVVKPFVKGWFDDKDKARAVVRLIAIIMGGVVGATVAWTPYAMWQGAGAGVFNAFIVALLKSRVGQQQPPVSRQESDRE